MRSAAPLTADELRHLNLPNKRTELVRGALVVREPSGFLHGRVAAKLAQLLMNHVEAGDLGFGFGAETGFALSVDPDTVRAPDAAFIRGDRVPHPPPIGFAAIAPDLVVEVLSPDDGPGEVLAKVGDWLSAGTSLVWVVDPVRRSARVYRADGSVALLTEADALDGETALPGFTCAVGTIF